MDLFEKLPDYAMAYRDVLAQTLDRMFEKNDKLVYMDADLVNAIKTGVLFEKYPERAFDCGIAEANMIGTAQGLRQMVLFPLLIPLVALQQGECLTRFSCLWLMRTAL